MKKTINIFLIVSLLLISQAKAQSLQDGINHLNADRFKSAVKTFQQLLATNPNNIDATYWLGQTYLDMDDNDAARDLYSKALQASANAPLLLVGSGHVDLLDNKTADARQKFETAITMTRNKKGEDNPAILSAIGRANVDAKAGDYNYAIEKLEYAAQKDPRNPEILLQLGNAYRKAKPGEGGGKAYENYNKALEVSPGFAVASVRLAKLFETQKNWELVTQNLNDAVKRDPKFSPAYYELFYYYFFAKQDYTEAENQLKKYIDSRLPETYIEDQSLYAQLCWARKDYDCAITKDLAVIAEKGTHTKPRVYKLLADSYLQKGDYTTAKKYIDDYLTKEKPEDIIGFDVKLKADIMSKMGAGCDTLYAIYLQGATYDTILQNKIDYLNQGVDYFRTKGCKLEQAKLQLYVYNLRTKPSPASLVNIGVVFSQAGELVTADSLFKAYADAFPDSIYGYDWRARTNFSLDTTMMVEPFATNMVQSYMKVLEIANNDKTRFKSQGIRAALILAGYYNNIKSDKASAISYVKRGLEIDSTNAQLKNIDSILNRPTKQPAPRGNSTPTKETKSPASKPAVKPKTTTKKNS